MLHSHLHMLAPACVLVCSCPAAHMMWQCRATALSMTTSTPPTQMLQRCVWRVRPQHVTAESGAACRDVSVDMTQQSAELAPDVPTSPQLAARLMRQACCELRVVESIEELLPRPRVSCCAVLCR